MAMTRSLLELFETVVTYSIEEIELSGATHEI